MRITDIERKAMKAAMRVVDHNWAYHAHSDDGDCPNCLLVARAVLRSSKPRRADKKRGSK